MAAPSPIATSKGASGTSDAGSYTPANAPSGSGGRLFYLIGSNDSAALTVDASVADDWYKIGQVSSGSTCSLALFKSRNSSPAALVVDSAASTQYSHFALRMPDETAVWLGLPATGSSSNPNLAANDHQRSREAYYLAVVASAGTGVVTGAPGGWGNLQTQAAGGANGASLSVFDKTATSSTEDPGAATKSAAQWAGLVLAFWTEPSRLHAEWDALAQTLSANANVLFRSTSLGMGATAASGGVSSNEHAGSVPARFAAGFTACKASSANWIANNGVNVTSGQLYAYDNRRNPGAAWDHSVGLGYTTLGGGFLTCPTSGQVLPTVVGEAFDRTEILYAKYSGSPQYTGKIDSGSATTLLMNNATPGFGVQTISGAGTTVNITSTGAGGFILALNTYLNGVPQLNVFGAGFFGATTTQMAEAVNFWGPIEATKFIAPKLVVTEGGANDDFNPLTQAKIDTFKLNLRTAFITDLRSGIAHYWTPPLNNPAVYGSEAAQKAIFQYAIDTCDELNVGCSILHNRTNWTTWAASVAAGFMASGSDPHLLDPGQQDVADMLLAELDPGPTAVRRPRFLLAA